MTVGRGRLRLAHVQLSDAQVGSPTTPDRLVPGDGDIPLGRLLIQINAAAYAGAFEIEMVGPRIEAEGYEPAIARAAAHCDALLGQTPAGTAPRGI
jgi:sugar phosphate isomerase/epimerase